MSPPEAWGPPVWNFIHTLAEKINEKSFNTIKNSFFLIIKKICLHLPCPECSQHANYFLMKVNISKINSKSEFKHMLFIFHNTVNKRKRKPIFNYNIVEKYKFMTIPNTYNNFINVYNTKGNLNLIMESFRRSIVIKELHLWLKQNYMHFRPTNISQINNNINNNDINNNDIIIKNGLEYRYNKYKNKNFIIIKNGLEYEIKNVLEDDIKNVLEDEIKNVLEDEIKNVLEDDIKNGLEYEEEYDNYDDECDDLFDPIIITNSFNIDSQLEKEINAISENDFEITDDPIEEINNVIETVIENAIEIINK